MIMKLTDKENNNLQKEIDHILDSGANSIRLLEMFDRFLERREAVNKNDLSPRVMPRPRFSEITKDSDDGAFSWILKDSRNADSPENNSDMIRRLVYKYNDLVKFLNGA